MAVNLTSKKAWIESVRALVEDLRWKEELRRGVAPADLHKFASLKSTLLTGFRQFYDPQKQEKYTLIQNATDLTYEQCQRRNDFSFHVHGPAGEKETVSFTCKRQNLRQDVLKAFRGAVDDYIRRKKATMALPLEAEMDHCNDGGFHGLVLRFLANHQLDWRAAAKHVRRLPTVADGRGAAHGNCYYVDLEEPFRTQWYEYHEANALLQPLTKEEHRRLTGKRRREARLNVV